MKKIHFLPLDKYGKKPYSASVEKKCKVLASAKFTRQIKKIPFFIKEAVSIWVETVEDIGIRSARNFPGYHDEPLHGDRRGQRSVRLNKAYRLFYTEDESGEVHLITIEEVNKHEY